MRITQLSRGQVDWLIDLVTEEVRNHHTWVSKFDKEFMQQTLEDLKDLRNEQ